MAGYSQTPLIKKLGIKANSELVIINEPEDFRRLITPLPEGARIVSRVSKKTDMIHIFTAGKSHLAGLLRTCLKQMAHHAVVWVSWPKKSSMKESEITEETIREIALPLGLVDIKVCAVDEVWSGLKLVVRKENRRPLE